MTSANTSTADLSDTSKKTQSTDAAPRPSLVRPEVLEWIWQLAQQSTELSRDPDRLRELKKKLF